MTRSRKRGPFPQKSDCELDISVDNAKSVVHGHVNRLTLVCQIPKLQAFEYHRRAYLGLLVQRSNLRFAQDNPRIVQIRGLHITYVTVHLKTNHRSANLILRYRAK